MPRWVAEAKGGWSTCLQSTVEGQGVPTAKSCMQPRARCPSAPLHAGQSNLLPKLPLPQDPHPNTCYSICSRTLESNSRTLPFRNHLPGSLGHLHPHTLTINYRVLSRSSNLAHLLPSFLPRDFSSPIFLGESPLFSGPQSSLSTYNSTAEPLYLC